MNRSKLAERSPVLPTHTRGQADDAFAGMAIASIGFFALGGLSGGATLLIAAACGAGALVNHWKDVVGEEKTIDERVIEALRREHGERAVMRYVRLRRSGLNPRSAWGEVRATSVRHSLRSRS